MRRQRERIYAASDYICKTAIHFADTDKYILPAQTNTFRRHRQIHFATTQIHFASTDKYIFFQHTYISPAQTNTFCLHRQIYFVGTDKYSSTQTALSALITMQLKLNFLSKDRIPTNIYTIVLLPWFQLKIRLYDPSEEQLHGLFQR